MVKTMKLSESYVTNRIVDIIASCTKPSQTLVAQKYLYLLISKIGDNMTEIKLIYKVCDMLEIKLKQMVTSYG